MIDFILLEAQLDNIATRADGTLKVILGTQELSPEMSAKLFALHRKHAHVLISPHGIGKDQIDIVKDIAVVTPKPAVRGKSPSQRMRNVFFVYWEQNGSKGDFDDFYEEEMDKVINHYKSKLI
ncbi:MAG: hypothetical protein H8E74_11860 [Gammaproteobacteria bacterium]|nr:hypothetical protein [Gammaproteobacteria bacterium]